MANTIEIRCPFLDKEVYAISKDLPLKDLKEKQILRNLFTSDLPKEITERQKTSFDVGSGIRKLVVEYLTKDNTTERETLKEIWCKFFDKNIADNDYYHKYPVFDKGKNYSGVNILKKKILLDFIEDNFLKELEIHQNSIIVPLGNTVSSTIDYLNTKHQLKLRCFLKGFPHPSGLNVRKNIQFKENKKEMLRLLKS